MIPRRVGAAFGPVLAALLVGVSACQPGSTASAPGPGSSGPGGAATLGPPTTFGPSPSPSPPDIASPVVLDPTLLAILPESIGGVPVTEALDEAALALTDPALPRIASALDVGVAVDPGSADLVSAHVVKLRPEAFTDATYEQWRSSYDEGACAASGGELGSAEATIDERTIHITSCVQGLRTYHVWLMEQDILISASSIGEARFGEQLMDNLRVPP